MPVSFLNPGLLIGLTASALPLIIHFLSRRRVQKRPFSDLRFLEEVRTSQSRRLGLRRWLILLLRMLAIFCIALAVAGPRWGEVVSANRGGRSVLFIVDASASMNTQENGGSRFTTAVTACSQMMETLPSDSYVQVLLADDTTRPLFEDWLPAGSGAIRSLSSLVGSDGSFSLAKALHEAGKQVARAPGSPVEIVLLSDLQGGDIIADGVAEGQASENLQLAVDRLLAVGTTNFMVKQIGQPSAGGGILSVILPGRVVRPGERVTITAAVLAEYPDQVFQLEIADRKVSEAVAPLGPGTIQTLEFPLTVPQPGAYRGVLRKDNDTFTADDTRPFVLDVPPVIDVLLVHGNDRPVDTVAGRGGWRYLAEALAPRGSQSLFNVTAISSADLTSGLLVESELLFLVDIDPLGRRSLQELTEWLSAGGAAAFLIGEPTAQSYLENTLWPALELSAQTSWRNLGANRHERVTVVDPEHPVFAGLQADAVLTMQEALWHQFFLLDEGSSKVLLSFTSESPAMLEGQLGQGHFVVLPFNLASVSTDLAANPMALPFFQRLAAWLARSGRGSGNNITVGVKPEIRVAGDHSTSGILENVDELFFISAATGDSRTAELVWRGATPVLQGAISRNAGFITCVAGYDTIGVVAAGITAAESALKLLTVEAWSERLTEKGLAPATDLTEIVSTEVVTALAGSDLTAWFFAFAALLLLAEQVLSRGTSRS